MAANVINVPIGPATVEWGASSPTIFDITKGGVQFQANFNKQDITVDQYGDTPVKSIIKGGTCQAVVPVAEQDLDKLAKVIPNSTLVTDGIDPTKKKIVVKGTAGHDLTADADKLVIKPTDPNATANDYITIPNASPMVSIEHTFDSDNERVYLVTFVGYVDTNGELFILGDESATA